MIHLPLEGGTSPFFIVLHKVFHCYDIGLHESPAVVEVAIDDYDRTAQYNFHSMKHRCNKNVFQVLIMV
ncbi:protein of unknown function [Serratia sp. Tan611]|nr:protein of unknown function [Serratia sp. Tan611]